jgi:hypothetical protein
VNTDNGGRDRPDPTRRRPGLDISAAPWLTWNATPARPEIAPQPVRMTVVVAPASTAAASSSATRPDG